ncbi:MAG: FUSC family protein [Verrucomicrobia bacterium]|nr:FUSC family protein [Verrucomicrobiota bacterium]
MKAAGVIAASQWQRAWRAFVALQSETAGTQIDWVEGLRAAFGIALPATVGLLMNHLVWGILCSFATLWVLMCDVGGAYRQKAINLVASGVTILCAYVFGGWMILSVSNYIVGMLLWVFAAGLVGIAGNAAAQAGTVSSTIVITSVVLFVPSEFWIRLLLCATGFGWALLLSLALWPLTPYAPILQAVSASCARLADLSASFWLGAAEPGRSANNLPFAIAYDRFMTSLERSRSIWGAFRARRAGPTSRSMGLLALIEELDDAARTLITLREEINLLGQEKWSKELREPFTGLTDSLSQLSREIAEAVVVAGRAVNPIRLQNAFQLLEEADIRARSRQEALSQQKQVFRTTKYLVEQAVELAETASQFSSGGHKFHEPPEARFGPRPPMFDPLVEIRSNISLRSSSFRHALRLGATSALGGLIAAGEHLVRGYWIPMTVVIVLKPNFGGTLQRSIQRITGTILGAVLAALLVASSQTWILWAVLPFLVFATFATRNFNYTLFSLALTPTVLLMLDIAHPITVGDSFLRILHTIIGSALALLSGYLLFPLWESSRLPIHIAEALRADADLVRALRSAVLGKQERPISEFRRNAAVAVSNAFIAGQRLLSEPPDRRGDVESSLAAVSYCRQILYVLAAISDYRTRNSVQFDSKEIAGFLQALAQALDDLATSLVDRVTPKQLLDLPTVLDQLESTFLEASHHATQNLSEPVTETRVSLFYHLKNAVELTLAAREAVLRLAEKGDRSQETEIRSRSPS